VSSEIALLYRYSPSTRKVLLASTLERFRDRLTHALSSVRVIGPLSDPLGFGMTKDAELYQVYVSADSRRAALELP
jgi:hypothetical protein